MLSDALGSNKSSEMPTIEIPTGDDGSIPEPPGSVIIPAATDIVGIDGEDAINYLIEA